MSAQEILALQTLEHVLGTAGVTQALRYLNARTPHRCTAVYRLRGMRLQNLYLFDRRGEVATADAPQPLGDSFCMHAVAERGWPASYYSLPLSRGPGDLLGTLCHFDYDQELVLPDTELAFLQRAAFVLVPHLPLQ